MLLVNSNNRITCSIVTDQEMFLLDDLLDHCLRRRKSRLEPQRHTEGENKINSLLNLVLACEDRIVGKYVCSRPA